MRMNLLISVSKQHYFVLNSNGQRYLLFDRKTIFTPQWQTKLLSSHVTPSQTHLCTPGTAPVQPSMSRSTGFWDISWAPSQAERALQCSLPLSSCWSWQQQGRYCWGSTASFSFKTMAVGHSQAPSLLPWSLSWHQEVSVVTGPAPFPPGLKSCHQEVCVLP